MLIANHLGALALLIDDRTGAAFGGLSRSAAACLLTLGHFAPLTTSALARRLGISQPTTVRVVDGLARAGLVERAARAGRGAPLGLTPAGRARAAALRAARLARIGELLAPLDGDEQANRGGLLDKVLGAATRDRAEAQRSCRLCAHDLCQGPACPIGRRADELDAQGRPGD